MGVCPSGKIQETSGKFRGRPRPSQAGAEPLRNTHRHRAVFGPSRQRPEATKGWPLPTAQSVHKVTEQRPHRQPSPLAAPAGEVRDGTAWAARSRPGPLPGRGARQRRSALVELAGSRGATLHQAHQGTGPLCGRKGWAPAPGGVCAAGPALPPQREA